MGSKRHSKTAKSDKKNQPPRRSKQAKTDAGPVRSDVDLNALPDASANQSLSQEQLLGLQSVVGNRLTRRLIQRQIPKTPVVVEQRKSASAHIIQRQPGEEDEPLPSKAPDAASLVAQDFPNLKLPKDKIAILQKVLDARLALKKGEKRLASINVTVMHGEPQGLTEQVNKYKRIDKKMDRYREVIQKYKSISVPAELILGDDILSQDENDRPAEIAFRESLYKTVLSQSTRLPIAPGLKPKPVFTGLEWGPARWKLSHDGGKVNFEDLIRVQKWNLVYQSVLVGEQIDIYESMEAASRQIGGERIDVAGKILGETYGHLWNTTIKVGMELGFSGGYYDDAKGRVDLSNAYLRAKGARCIIRGPDNWLHIFALEPFNSYDMKGKTGDEYVYLLTKGAEVTAERVTTSDGFELDHGSGKTGAGWRMKQILDETEQFAVGSIFGDLVEDPSVTMSVGQIIIGCVPIVGQIADARDVAAGIYKMWKTGGKDGKVQTMLALVGFIPLFGDGVKAAKKAFKTGGRGAAKETFARMLQEGVPQATEDLAKKILKNPDELAKALSISKKELGALSELAKEATVKGGMAAEKYAKEMTKYFDHTGGNAAAVVLIGGGKWNDVAKALAASPSGEALGKRMQAWRRQRFRALSKKIEHKASEFGVDVASGRPKMISTGTDSYLSDMDVSFKGPHSSVHKNAAIRQMQQEYGWGWRKILDADIFADPSRLHLFDEPLEKVGSKAGLEAQARISIEATTNVFAKMLQSGADIKEVSKLLADSPAELAAVIARQKELTELSTDYLANMLRKGAPREMVEGMAGDLGVSMKAVEAYKKSGKDLYRKLELKLDLLHKRFLNAKGDPKKQLEIAEEMAEVQGKLNAAVKGPYVTPGGAAKHVTRREMKLRPKGKYKPLSPAMAYTAVLDDYYMLQNALKDVGTEFTEKQAKDMAKYADRLIITAGQFGVDMTKRNTRALWEDMVSILERARLTNKKPPLSKLQQKMNRAKSALEGQLNDLTKAVEKNAEEYMGTLPSRDYSGDILVDLIEGLKSGEVLTIIALGEVSVDVILRQIGIIQRIKLRQGKEGQDRPKELER